GKGDIVIYDPNAKEAYFITKNGVLFKKIELTNPDSFATYKYLVEQIHNTSDSLFIDAEWIGDNVYWTISTSGLNTRNASDIGLVSTNGLEVIRLCTKCTWTPVFDALAGKTSHYRVTGETKNVSIDEWNAVYDFTYVAVPGK
ncbi:MAG TPA: hypothetical protein VJ508_03325, partial [Saprospiraceae bacterium]|nr:hypothetical protein [Saprospiraceae bacterium]